MSKCKHLILIWLDTVTASLGQFSWYEERYKCKSCDGIFTIKEMEQ